MNIRESRVQQIQYTSPIKKKNTTKPDLLSEMTKLAETLYESFFYVRVDLYLVDNKIYFGELTFKPQSGYIRFVPESFDKFLGDKLKLPINSMNVSKC